MYGLEAGVQASYVICIELNAQIIGRVEELLFTDVEHFQILVCEWGDGVLQLSEQARVTRTDLIYSAA
jgi:hypothetical protein